VYLLPFHITSLEEEGFMEWYITKLWSDVYTGPKKKKNPPE
jgi:hypothetical protein